MKDYAVVVPSLCQLSEVLASLTKVGRVVSNVAVEWGVSLALGA
jgi:predicted transcriptional regulator